MIKYLKLLSAALVGASLLAAPKLAQAQQLTLRVEPGVAVPLTNPQSGIFNVGVAAAVKPELGIGSYLSVGPSVSAMALPAKADGVDTGTLWAFGGFLRVKRPHDEKNTGHDFSAASPWVDADLQYVRTGPLDRFGWSAAAGVSFPTSDARTLWVGPFVRYQSVFQEDKPGFNGNSAKVAIIGLSFEFGARATKKSEPTPNPTPPVVVNPVPTPEPTPPPAKPETTVVELKQTVQFAWDSPVIDSTAEGLLTDVIKKLTASNSFESIKIEGHASSEGQVEHNDALSLKRASAVVDFLVAHGISRDKLSATGFGSRVPVATNKTPAGRILNRRAEFVVKFVVVKESK